MCKLPHPCSIFYFNLLQGAESIKLGARDVSVPSSASSSVTSSPVRTPHTPTTQTGNTSQNAPEDDLFAPVAIETVDDESGIIRVWFLLLEGLTGAVSMCPKQHQPQTLELLFELLRSVLSVPGKLNTFYAKFVVVHRTKGGSQYEIQHLSICCHHSICCHLNILCPVLAFVLA